MKTTNVMAVAAAVCLLTFTNCKKEAKNPADPTSTAVNAEAPIDYGVSVQGNRLKFSSMEKFNAYISLNRAGLKKFAKYVKGLGFTSKKELMASQVSSRTSEECNCTTDDIYVNEIVNANYMVDIEDWTVKINVCDQRFYAIDRLDLSAGEGMLDEKIDAMEKCNFATEYGFYSYSFDYELMDVLKIQRDIINGNATEEEFERCGDDACSDRICVVEATTQTWTQPVPPNFVGPPQTLEIVVPKLTLKYEKGIFNGWTDIYATSGDSWEFNLGFEETQYREKCHDLHTRAGGAVSMNAANNTVTYNNVSSVHFGEYSGKRLKAGEGNVKVKLQSYAHGSIESTWAEIVF